MADTDKILVRITATERVQYEKTVEMTRKEWAHYKSQSEKNLSDGGLPLDSYDIQDGDGYDDIEMIVVDEKDKPIEPRDEYTGGDEASH